MDHTSLLEYLKQKIGCLYLSDLPLIQFRGQIIKELEAQSSGSFSMKEWNDTVSYITKEPISFQTESDALEYLKHHK